MSSALNDLSALNEQIAALIEAGVPLDVGLTTGERRIPIALERINAAVAQRVEHGESLTEALEDDEQLTPTRYRCLVQLGLRSGTMQGVLSWSNRMAATIDQAASALGAALFYPLSLCFLAYVGMIGFCLGYVPALTNLYASLRIPSGVGLETLQFLRSTLAYWVAIPGIAMAWLLVRQLRQRWQVTPPTDRSKAQLKFLPGIARTLHLERCANFADSLATLTENGVAMEEGLRLAACASGDPQLSEGSRALAASLRNATYPAEDGPTAQMFPPFLRWALWHGEAATGNGQALRMAAGIYRGSAERRTERLKMLAPILACVFIGGVVTLLYGLALFVPVVEMLKALAY